MSADLTPLVGSLRQIASVRGVTLSDGPENGVRALIFSTGGGLDFTVLPDRAMDIATLSYRGTPLAWQSPAGFRHPALHDAEADGGYGFDRSLSGFLVTAGLDHTRHPRDGRPHHGRVPFTPARLIAAGENWDAARPHLFCEGEVVQWRYGGEGLRLVRRVEADIGGTTLRIGDRVENVGGEPVAPALLYHFNLGYPAIGPGSRVTLDGRPLADPLAALPEAEAAPATLYPCGEAGEARCVLVTPHGDGELTIAFVMDATTLPFVQLWRDLRPRRGIFSVEPCSDDGETRGDPLAPEESRSFRVSVGFEGAAPPLATRLLGA